MITIVLPTKNRPTSFHHWLQYMTTFYPQAMTIVIANGSTPHYLPRYQEIIAQYKGPITLNHMIYDEKTSLSDRLIHVLNQLTDEFIIFSGDDDFPILETMQNGIEFLASHPDYVLAIGPMVHFQIFKKRKTLVNAVFSLPIDEDDMLTRLKKFCRHSFATFYAVQRREHVLDNLKKTKGLMTPGFMDYLFSIYNCLEGKIKYLDNYCFLRTQNDNHSYYKKSDPFGYLLTNGDKILAIRKMVTGWIVERSQLKPQQAFNLTTELFSEYISRLLMGDSFDMSSLDPRLTLKDKHCLNLQNNMLKSLNDPNHHIGRQYQEKVFYITTATLSTMQSNDNEFEKHVRGTH